MPASDELRGVIVPLITPVHDDDTVDEPSLRKLVRRLIGADLNTLFVAGSAGEGPLLSFDQWVRLLEVTRDEAGDKAHLLAGVMETSTRRVIEKIKAADRIGYKYFVLTPTFYQPIVTASEQLRLFGEARAAASDRMEMIAYNIPGFTASTVAVETVCEAAKRGWTRYYKDSSGDMNVFWKLVEQGRAVGLNVLMGDERFIADGLFAGACGMVPVCANYEPETFVRAWQAHLDRDYTELLRLQMRVLAMRQTMLRTGPCWISGLKYALSKLGIGNGRAVSPLEPVDEARKKLIDEMVGAQR